MPGPYNEKSEEMLDITNKTLKKELLGVDETDEKKLKKLASKFKLSRQKVRKIKQKIKRGTKVKAR